MAAGDYTFNYTNLNPLNTSGWSTSSLAQQIKARQDAEAQKAAADAAQASVYGHVNAGKGGGGGSNFDPVTGIAGLALAGPLGGALGGAGGSLFGGSDPRTPAEKLAHQTKMLAKQEGKTEKTAADLANSQHDIDALNAAIAKATDPKVIEHLTKDLEKAQKQLGKVQQKHDANTSHVDEVKKKITGLNPASTTTGAAAPTEANYFNDLVDKTLGSRDVSGWHTLAGVGTPVANTPSTAQTTTTGMSTGTDLTNTGVATATDANGNQLPAQAPPGFQLPTDHVNKYLRQQAKTMGVKPNFLKQQVKSGWGSAPVIT